MLNTAIQQKIEESLKEINFPIAITDIPTIPSEMCRKLVRTDNGQPLGLIKSRYKPIKHYDAFGGALKSMAEGGLDLTDAQIKVNSYEFGAMAKMEVIMPNLTEKVGTHDLQLKYIARNSYNGMWKFQSFFGWLNTVCFNTQVSGQQLAYSSSKHTNLFDIKASNEKIYTAVEAVKGEAQSYKDWWYTKVEDEQVADMFQKTICKKKSNISKFVSEDTETNKKRLSQLMDLYTKEKVQIHGNVEYTQDKEKVKGSLWCAFQASTYWSTHVEKTMSKKEYKSYIIQRDRQECIRKMLNSNSWKNLESGFVPDQISA